MAKHPRKRPANQSRIEDGSSRRLAIILTLTLTAFAVIILLAVCR